MYSSVVKIKLDHLAPHMPPHLQLKDIKLAQTRVALGIESEEWAVPGLLCILTKSLIKDPSWWDNLENVFRDHYYDLYMRMNPWNKNPKADNPETTPNPAQNTSAPPDGASSGQGGRVYHSQRNQRSEEQMAYRQLPGALQGTCNGESTLVINVNKIHTLQISPNTQCLHATNTLLSSLTHSQHEAESTGTEGENASNTSQQDPPPHSAVGAQFSPTGQEMSTRLSSSSVTAGHPNPWDLQAHNTDLKTTAGYPTNQQGEMLKGELSDIDRPARRGDHETDLKRTVMVSEESVSHPAPWDDRAHETELKPFVTAAEDPAAETFPGGASVIGFEGKPACENYPREEKSVKDTVAVFEASVTHTVLWDSKAHETFLKDVHTVPGEQVTGMLTGEAPNTGSKGLATPCAEHVHHTDVMQLYTEQKQQQQQQGETPCAEHVHHTDVKQLYREQKQQQQQQGETEASEDPSAKSSYPPPQLDNAARQTDVKQLLVNTQREEKGDRE